jgi:hypothetical protein
MKSQIRLVIVASVAGLAMTLLSNWSDLIRAGYGASLHPSNPFNGNVLGYWTGMLSSAPLIFVVVAVVVTARKAGLRNSILNGLGAIVGVTCVSLATTYAIIAVAAAALPKKELPFADAGPARDSFIKGALDSCVQKQKALPQNKDVPAATIDGYCSCLGNSLADVATKAEVAVMAQRQTTPDLAEKLKTASQKCMQLAQGQR